MTDPRERLDRLFDALLAAPETIATLPREQIVLLLSLAAARQGQLAAVQSGLTARLFAEFPMPAPVDPEAGRLLTVAEAAEIISVPPRWITQRANRLPFVRHLGPRQLRISEAELRRWVSKKKPASSR